MYDGIINGFHYKSYLAPENIKEYGYQVPISSLVPGDLVYYDNGGNGATHIAVYVGQGKAVHGGFESDKKVVVYTIYPPNASSPIGYKIK